MRARAVALRAIGRRPGAGRIIRGKLMPSGRPIDPDACIAAAAGGDRPDPDATLCQAERARRRSNRQKA